MKTFCYTVDDNIRFLKEISENQFDSLFDHPYLAMYKVLHEKFSLKVQLNLFNRLDDFTLADMSDRYASEWAANADWLKLSFHSEYENVNPYMFSGYDEVYRDCNEVQRQILRFAGSESLGKTTTVHYCQTTQEGLRALRDNGVAGLLGLFGTEAEPGTSHEIDLETAKRIRGGETVKIGDLYFASIDLILNRFSNAENLRQLEELNGRGTIRVMIHEQYFYPDYKAYQPDFEEKLTAAFSFLTGNGYQSRLFEECIAQKA